MRGEDFNLILTRYGIERLLYRLSVSPHAERFLLRGAMLFALWTDKPHRPTRDLDLLGFGPTGTQEMESVFREVVQTKVVDDGLRFGPASVSAEEIREDNPDGGVRVRLAATMAQARVPVQIDIGSGDVVTPSPEIAEFPSLLGFPSARIRSYPIYTVIAEKLEAATKLAMQNTRMKDFYDLWCLPRLFPIDEATLKHAVQATFARRGTPLPVSPHPFTDSLATDSDKDVQWRAFLRRNQLECPASFAEVVRDVPSFVYPILQKMRDVRG